MGEKIIKESVNTTRMSLVKNAKQLLNEHCQREKLPNPSYVSAASSSGYGFMCTLTVCGQTFTTPSSCQTKKVAELEAAKVAVSQLNIQEVKSEPKEKKSENGSELPGPPKAKAPKPTVKEPGWITIEKVEDIYKHLSDEVLAQEVKAFLHCKAQEEKKNYPVFTVTEVQEPIPGFTCVVNYDNKNYESLGLMNSKRQAEQSASEVCLRSIGQFPAVSKDQYTIQVYHGGKLAVPASLAKKQQVA